MAQDDFIRLTGGPYPSNALPMPEQFGWPAPDRLVVLGLAGEVKAVADAAELFAEKPDLDGTLVVYRKVGESQLTDEQIASMTHVARGAEYELEVDPMASDRGGSK